ncbi:MAG: zinc-ribbon domain-containing protein [Promethearchaeota archaeon]
MYCPKCGSNVADEAKFCTFCGEPLEGEKVPESEPIQPTPSISTPYQDSSITPVKKPTTSGAIALGIIIALVIGGVLIYFGFRSLVGGYTYTTGLTMLIIGVIFMSSICCFCGGCSSGRRRGGYYGGGCDCSGCDCGDCDCGDCDC